MTTQDEFSILSYIALNRPTEYALSAQPGFDYSHYHQLLDRHLVHVHPATHVCTLTRSGMERFVALKDLLGLHQSASDQFNQPAKETKPYPNRNHVHHFFQKAGNYIKKCSKYLCILFLTAFFGALSTWLIENTQFLKKVFEFIHSLCSALFH